MKSALRQDMGADFINFSFLQSNTALNPANYTQKTPAVQQTTDVFLLTKIFFLLTDIFIITENSVNEATHYPANK